ncbi:MAG TPA: hypothetical protein VLG38_05745 [Gammaproteobacteria bacterium]|nr:hypothetical protein [Gammaproteobacteria bacterium]
MNKVISTEEKERIIDLGYSAVRSGLANGDFMDIDIKIKSIMREHLNPESYDAQIYMVRDFIGYMRKRIQVPGGRLGIIALINVGRARHVPEFLLQCGTAIWGTWFSNKANSAKLRELFLT